ncbi:hypothetical protein A2U01_0054708, partial [Trifolium medium]|nr:hypothetical protein [Trifolium medium]
ACIRDETGQFVQAFGRNYAGKPLIAEAEAKGCASNQIKAKEQH